jgi:hypothetical protein
MIEPRIFHIESDDQHRKLLSFLRARPVPFQVEFGPIREVRTLPQNSRLFALHALAAKETGYTVEELHEEALCRHFGYTEKKMPTGWVKRVPLKRSSAREKKEFTEFMEVTEAFYASELGIWLGMNDV